MNEFYIVTSGGLYGHYGKGHTLEAARTAWKKAGGKKKEGNYREQKFTSQLPFVPANEGRLALETEADAWIGQDGSTNWVRCERLILRWDAPTGAHIPLDEKRNPKKRLDSQGSLK